MLIYLFFLYIYNVTVTIREPEAMNLRGNVRARERFEGGEKEGWL